MSLQAWKQQRFGSLPSRPPLEVTVGSLFAEPKRSLRTPWKKLLGEARLATHIIPTRPALAGPRGFLRQATPPKPSASIESP
jgi:hypothetical protein